MMGANRTGNRGDEMGVGTEEQTAFSFDGDWRELLPILFSNLLLTVVTLGFYRFWGIARERRYLWSKTRFIDDRLEWTGTGKELFLGFLIVIVILFLPIFVLQFVAQALLIQGQRGLAAILGISVYLILFYVVGLAVFRGIRYRLSRTLWHGIRGGSDDQGFAYAWSYTWKTIVGSLCLGLMIPWSMTSLWQERWNAMSFGPHRFESGPEWNKLMPRFLLFYLVPIGSLILGAIVAFAAASSMSQGLMAGVVALLVLSFYVALPLVALIFYAAFFREMIDTLNLSTLDFQFTARTKDWLLLFLGNAALYLAVLVPAGIVAGVLGLFGDMEDPSAFYRNMGGIVLLGLAVAIPLGLIGGLIRYRSWRFFIRHMEASGEIDLANLTQSQTRLSKQGEGLLDALDMGAI